MCLSKMIYTCFVMGFLPFGFFSIELLNVTEPFLSIFFVSFNSPQMLVPVGIRWLILLTHVFLKVNAIGDVQENLTECVELIGETPSIEVIEL